MTDRTDSTPMTEAGRALRRWLDESVVALDASDLIELETHIDRIQREAIDTYLASPHDLRAAAQGLIEAAEDILCYPEGAVGFEELWAAIKALRAALDAATSDTGKGGSLDMRQRPVTRYMNHGGFMAVDLEGQWVHVKDLRAKGWKLDPMTPDTGSFAKHPLTCGLCPWGRSPENHSEDEYRKHMRVVHATPDTGGDPNAEATS